MKKKLRKGEVCNATPALVPSMSSSSLFGPSTPSPAISALRQHSAAAVVGVATTISDNPKYLFSL